MSSDTIEFKRAEQRKKRGSRVWLAEKLNAIEASGGIDARRVAADKWASLVWHNPHEAAFGGADVVEQIYNLSSIFKKIKDPAAADRISEIIHGGDDEQIKKVGAQLGSERIKKAVQMQTMDEEQICRIAKPYCTRENPTGHLKARKHLRKEAKQGTALLNMHLGLIGRDGHHHATPHELKMRNDQKGRWRKFGESVTLRRGDDEISMLDVMKSANKKKLAEILTLTKGLENHAKAAGMTWAFKTLTAPPRMHPNPKNGHSTWDGTTPDEAHKWILDAYQKAESRLRTTHGIVISGLRVVESHDDACPHWHVLVFAHASDMDTIEATFRQQPEWKSEVGMEFVLNDGTASAVSYVFKYITKTINSVEKLEGEHGSVDAWRSTWGIRAFQFFGMPPMKLWRNLREVKECPEEPLIAGLWRAANSGDGHAYIRLAGGLNVKAKDRPVITQTTGDGKTKSIEFILQETSESIRFNIEKWQQTKAAKSPEANKTVGLGVILNYPRRSKTKSEPIKFACGSAGDDPLHPDKEACSLIRGRIPPHHSPFSPPVGIAEGQTNNQHSTGALVGALQDHTHCWWTDIDMKKAPSLIRFNETLKKTGKRIYKDYPSQENNGTIQ